MSTKNDGKLSLAKHSKTAKHIQNISNLKTMCLKNFVLTKNSEEHEKVTIAEVCTVYHGIKHNQSYVSMSCNTDLNHLIFSDSKICKKNFLWSNQSWIYC